MGENGEKSVEIKSEKRSETDSEKEFFILKINKLKRKFLLKARWRRRIKDSRYNYLMEHITTNGSTN